MSWAKVENKPTPSAGTQLLCAWQPSTKQGSWLYAVLCHWPDGQWTDDADDVVEAGELPHFWQAISKPLFI